MRDTPCHDDVVDIDRPARAPRGAHAVLAHARQERGNETGACRGFGTLPAQHLHRNATQRNAAGTGLGDGDRLRETGTGAGDERRE